ncbi:DUF6891 domain-containing protein [Streptomyces olivochromogenes]|uniref:DUF6891 domain-containing protein n=1 Tax=Streptomyces olivochromogenes TaxID=1963 RepID=UPI001F47F245|nr:hypothetical protein [Streptomyces olivochromogenes]MCF3133319.1 hypothetical protein [Streptomyces olivochromogenes]
MGGDNGKDAGGTLPIKVETENSRTHAWVSERGLRELVERIGGPRDQFLAIQRIPDIPDVFAQVWHEKGGDYRLEHRRGEAGFFGTDLTDRDRVVDLLTGWARQRDGWDAGVDWRPVDLGPREKVPELPDEVRTRVEEHVRLLLRCGYDTRKALAEAAEDHLVEGKKRPVSGAQARQLVDRLWLMGVPPVRAKPRTWGRLAEQETWEGVTDPERLTLAFGALEETGITAREDFTCCRSCGMTEIGAEREGARGFVFFHRQGTERAAEGGGLGLYYGGFDGSAETTTAVGREVVTALTAAELSTMWDGDSGQAIDVTSLTWHKRLVG